MKHLFIASAFLLILVEGVTQSHLTRRQENPWHFPRESALLNIRDSILIGKYFVAVKGIMFDSAAATNPINAKVFVKGYANSETIHLKDLKQYFTLLCSDSTKPITDGSICLLKPKSPRQSRSFYVHVQDLKDTPLPWIDILEEGDIIAFVGMRCFDRVMRDFRTLTVMWYRIVK
jgi:hypothetical protein